MDTLDFLPVSRQDMERRGWYWYDILLITGDAYVDHPSFGAAVISRLLEGEFIDYEKIISQEDAATTVVGRQSATSSA